MSLAHELTELLPSPPPEEFALDADAPPLPRRAVFRTAVADVGLVCALYGAPATAAVWWRGATCLVVRLSNVAWDGAQYSRVPRERDPSRFLHAFGDVAGEADVIAFSKGRDGPALTVLSALREALGVDETFLPLVLVDGTIDALREA